MEWRISIIKAFGKTDDSGVESEIKMTDAIEPRLINC